LGRTFTSIQALRAVAACAVLVGHALTFKLGMGFDVVALAIFRIFPAGVDLFFVISGFIIFHGVLSSDGDRFPTAFKFAAKRALRIYPLYWLVLAAAFIASYWVPLGYETLPKSLEPSNFFLMRPQSYYLPISWTLWFEVRFYMIVAVLLLLVPKFVFPASLAIVVLVGATSGDTLFVEFAFGGLIAFLARRGVSSQRAPCLVVAIGLFALAYVLAADSPLLGLTRVSTYGIASALLVYGAVATELRGAKFSLTAQYLGNASYSIYLWHWPILAVLVALEPRMVTLIPGPVLIVVWIGIAMAVSVISYEHFERPVLALGREALKGIVVSKLTFPR
jgi:exopolysaccharide production protein ExoZ